MDSVSSRETRASISSTRDIGRPIVLAPMVSTSRPVRPACWADASSSTPTWRPGFGMSWKCSPPIVTSPAVGEVSPTMTRMVVVFPAPLGPRKPVTVPGLHTKLMSSTAMKFP